MGGDLVRYRRHGRVAEIVLDRPAKLNAISSALLSELHAAMYRFDLDDDAWVAVLSGAGRSFCAGADVYQRMASAEARGVSPVPPLTKVFLARYQHYKPVITAVQGHAFGGGFLLVLLSDLVVADETATFQVSEVMRGMDATTLWAYLGARAPQAVADEVCLTGRVLTAAEAERCAVVHRVVPAGEHVTAARALADQVLRVPPLAARTIVRERRGALERIETEVSLRSRERSLHRTHDFAEAVAAFTEGRPPVFRAE